MPVYVDRLSHQEGSDTMANTDTSFLLLFTCISKGINDISKIKCDHLPLFIYVNLKISGFVLLKLINSTLARIFFFLPRIRGPRNQIGVALQWLKMYERFYCKHLELWCLISPNPEDCLVFGRHHNSFWQRH